MYALVTRVAYVGGGKGVCPRSKQSAIPSDAVVRAFSVGKPKVVSQNLIKLTCECSALDT
jgi:bifunctional DNase/RNase